MIVKVQKILQAFFIALSVKYIHYTVNKNVLPSSYFLGPGLIDLEGLVAELLSVHSLQEEYIATNKPVCWISSTRGRLW